MNESSSFSDKTIAAGTLWSFAGFVSLALSAFLFNIFVARIYGPAGVGVFNQAFAALIIAGQAAALGIPASALHYSSIIGQDRLSFTHCVTSALVPVALTGTVVAFLFWVSSPLLHRFFDSADTVRAILFIAPAIPFFAINKALLNIVNGLDKIQAFALFQIMRFLFNMILLAIFVAYGADMTTIPLCLTGAETALFVFLCIYISLFLSPAGLLPTKPWISNHLRFGLKSYPGGLVSEANTRIDILALGYFMSDSAVGIYTIAAMVVEGLAQLAMVLSYPFNPHLAKEIAAGKWQALQTTMRRWVRRTYIFFIPACAMIFIFFDILPAVIIDNANFSAGKTPLLILLCGFAVGSGFYPFSMLLSQAGYPGWQTVTRIVEVSSNLILNIIFIPVIGINGAAVGTAVAYALRAVFLKITTKRLL